MAQGKKRYPQPTKICNFCHIEKSESEFYKNKASNDGIASKCKKCSNQSSSEWRKNNPEKRKAQKKRYRIRLKQKISEGAVYSERKCRVCRAVKPAKDFDKDSYREGGIKNICKLCDHKARNERYRKAHPQIEKVPEVLISGNLYVCPKCRNDKEWNQFNHERTMCDDCWREARHATYMRNREYYKEKVREYNREHPDVKINHRRRRRAWKKGSKGSFTNKEFKLLCEKYNWMCLKCGGKFDNLTPDHVVPLSKGGSNSIDNIQPLCLNCNVRKNASIVDYRKKYETIS